MSLKHIIFTEENLISPRWTTAMPDALIMTDTAQKPLATAALIWVLTGINHWKELINHYSQQGNLVIAMTRNGNIEELQAALNAGAKGYLDAFSNKDILQQATQSVMNSALWLPAPLVSGLVGILSKVLAPTKTTSDILSPLTLREREVVNVVLTGASNKQIAKELNITERTVKEHLSSVFTKLHVSDRLQLMLKVHG